MSFIATNHRVTPQDGVDSTRSCIIRSKTSSIRLATFSLAASVRSLLELSSTGTESNRVFAIFDRVCRITSSKMLSTLSRNSSLTRVNFPARQAALTLSACFFTADRLIKEILFIVSFIQYSSQSFRSRGIPGSIEKELIQIRVLHRRHLSVVQPRYQTSSIRAPGPDRLESRLRLSTYSPSGQRIHRPSIRI